MIRGEKTSPDNSDLWPFPFTVNPKDTITGSEIEQQFPKLYSRWVMLHVNTFKIDKQFSEIKNSISIYLIVKLRYTGDKFDFFLSISVNIPGTVFP